MNPVLSTAINSSKAIESLQKQREEIQKSKLDLDSKHEEINKFKSLKEQAKPTPKIPLKKQACYDPHEDN